jgi:hypothetical protein
VLEHCVPSVVGIPAVSISSFKNAVKRTDQARAPVGRVQAVGVFERVVVERDDRIDIRPTLVKGGDAIKITPDQDWRAVSRSDLNAACMSSMAVSMI